MGVRNPSHRTLFELRHGAKALVTALPAVSQFLLWTFAIEMIIES